MVELTRHEPSEDPLTAVQIAEKRNIPEKYLVHILLQLKRAGLVRSVRGAQGGYLLARPSSEITLFDIVQAIDGAVPGVSALAAPVFADGGRIVLCIAAIGPTAIFDARLDGVVADALRRCAQDLSRQLGAG